MFRARSVLDEPVHDLSADLLISVSARL